MKQFLSFLKLKQIFLLEETEKIKNILVQDFKFYLLMYTKEALGLVPHLSKKLRLWNGGKRYTFVFAQPLGHGQDATQSYF